jgi:Zn-dependent protease
MPICYHCGTEVSESFHCSRCGQSYCSFHKDPLDHECNIVIESLNFRSQQNSQITPSYIPPPQGILQNVSHSNTTDGVIRGTSDGSYTWYHQEQAVPEDAFDPDSGISFKGIFLAHKSELTHFLIAGIIIYAIGIMSFYSSVPPTFFWTLFVLAGLYVSAFLFHELGHRQVAVHFKLQTKFRLLTYGLLMTLLSFGRFALPGAVVVLGLDKISRKTGLCKAAGPLVNLAYGLLLFLISFIIPKSLYPLNLIFCIGAYLNFMLGSFNMIPFGILDGQNIWKWKKNVYFGLIGSLVPLLIITLVIINTTINLDLYLP